MGYFNQLQLVSQPYDRGYQLHDQKAQWTVTCAHCGSGTMLAIAIGEQPKRLRRSSSDSAAWLMCVGCGMGAFAVGDSDSQRVLYPQADPFGVPENLSQEVSTTWEEALRSYVASAFTGCALMCRKIIFHMAVEAGLLEKNAKGFAPNFAECVKYLVDQGYITKRQQDQWVDSIREWGNTATHELAPISKEVAYSALQFTHQLLQMVYAFPYAAPGESTDKESIVPSRSGVSFP